MVTFQFSNDHVIDFDFCGKIHKQIAVTTDLMKRFQAASDLLNVKDAEIKNTSDPNVLDTMCDCVMDAIDMILGDGEADRILELKGNYTVFDAIDVFKYIFGEINSGINGLAITYGNSAAPQFMNRAQRRAAHR